MTIVVAMVTFQRRLQMSLLICSQNNNNIYDLILATTIIVADSNLIAMTLWVIANENFLETNLCIVSDM